MIMTIKFILQDYHHEYMAGGVGSAVPDRTNNYQVISVYERDGRTTAVFQRLLDTQDPAEDIAIQVRCCRN